MRASSNQAKLCLLPFARGLDDLGEAAWVQARATYEGAVDVRLTHQFACVLRFHAAAILNAHVFARRVVGHFAQRFANERVRFLSLLRRRIAPGADGPDRLVRDHCFLQVLRRQAGETPAQLHGHYFLTHQFLSVSAATPGSSLPSSNSSEAPPPVEINVILSARPACLTAVTESPPPIIVVAPDCAIASAIAIVPSPNSGISKTPMGPFHKIVSALAISSW